MLAYSFKGQKCTTRSTNYARNYFVIRDEIVNIFPELDPDGIEISETIITVFYDCFEALVRVNNYLVIDCVQDAKNILESTLMSCEKVVSNDKYLSELPTGRIIAKMLEWSSLENTEELKWDVVSEMNHWEKAGFVVVSGCNKKSDSWSFSKYSK